MAATGMAVAAPGLAGETALAPPVLTMVVAGLPAGAGLIPGFTAALAATAPTAAAATPAATGATGTGFAAGKLPPARTAAGGRLGLTVMRAVSLGGADLTMVVPDLLLASGIGAGEVAAAFRGAAPGGGGVTTVVAGVGGGGGVVRAAGATGRTGLAGAMGGIGAIGAGTTGLTGLTGSTAAGGGLIPGATGAGGRVDFTGETPPGIGMTGGGGPAFGVPVGVAVGMVSMGCILLG